ncbi:MAG: phenolic acid decarboxylase [Chloroflexota bacterium]
MIGKTIEYQYENGDSYQVELTEAKATWTALTGSAAGATGDEDYDCVEVAPNIFMIGWLESSGEVVTLVVNLDEMAIHCNYVYEKDRHFWRGKVISVS